MKRHYSLTWTSGNESLQSLERFFNGDSLDVMLQKVRDMMRVLPEPMALVVRHAVLTGLRPSEAVESVRLINSNSSNSSHQHLNTVYYNPERQCLEHFRFPHLFLRRTKKAYISYITKEQLSPVALLGFKTPTHNAIRLAVKRKGLNMEMHLTRKIFASHLRQSGIQPEVVDMLQGRVSQSILTRHYLVPRQELKEQVLTALKQLQGILL